MSNKVYFQKLLQLYLSDTLSESEHDEFLELVKSNEFDELLSQSIESDISKSTLSNVDLPPHIAQEIVRKIYKREQHANQLLLKAQKKTTLRNWLLASSIVIFLSFSIYLILNFKNQEKAKFSTLIPSTSIKKVNLTTQEEKIILSDGSIVILKPQSKLYFAQNFNQEKREVFLEGEAFFKVAKNSQKPFLVYSNDIVTKVLGTSFTINANKETGSFEVAVKTGVVKVYENEALLKKTKPTNTLILLPNQRAMYKIEDREFESSLVEAPEPLHFEEPLKRKVENFKYFDYSHENLKTIFDELSQAYEIEILVENDNLNHCLFSGDISSQDLYTKLKIICLATNSNFEIVGTKILIKGNGCNDELNN